MRTLKKPKVAKPKILLKPRREDRGDQSIDLGVKGCHKEEREDYSVGSREGSILESSFCAYVSALGEKCKSYACRGSNLCAVHSKMVGMTRLDTIREHYASKSKIEDDRSKNSDLSVKVAQEEHSSNLRNVGFSVSSKFDVGKHPLLYIKLSKEGKSDVEIASLFQISISTLMRWVHDYEEMKEAYEIGQTMYEAFFLTKGVQNLENDRFNNVLFKYLTMNKLGYSDKVETKSTMQGLHGVVVIPNTLSIQEWEAQSIAKEEKERQLDLLDQKRRLEPPL